MNLRHMTSAYFFQKCDLLRGQLLNFSYGAEPGLTAANAAGAGFSHAHAKPIEQIHHFTARTIVDDECFPW